MNIHLNCGKWFAGDGKMYGNYYQKIKKYFRNEFKTAEILFDK